MIKNNNLYLRNGVNLIRRDWGVAVFTFSLWLTLQISIIAIHEIKGIPYFNLTGDPAAITGTPPWLGYISQTGLLFWSAAAAFCALAFAVRRSNGVRDRTTTFLLTTSCFTVLLAIDDAYLLHEEVLPHFGIPQVLVLIGYMVLALSYLCCFFKSLLFSNLILLLCAAGGLGISLLSDATHLYLLDPHLFEDSFKLFGVVFWAAYCYSISYSGLTEPREPYKSS